MRLAVGAAALGLFALVPAAPAYADGTGQIDHVEAAESGRVQMLFSVPDLGAGTPLDLDSVAVSVAGKSVDATASTVEAGQVRRTAVLALDVSESMRGDRFAAAKDAALAYLDAAPGDLAVGLVTFAGSVEVAQPPTTDHERLQAEIAGLELSFGTRLYDGVLESLQLLGGDGLRQVVVLSDGADTGSTRLADVVGTARRSGATVDVVALEQNARNQAALRRITDATSGAVLPADDPKAVAALFARAAEALAQQVLIEFRSPLEGEATVSASLAAGEETFTDSTFVALPASNAGARSAAPPIPVRPPGPWADERVLFAGAGALAMGLLLVLSVLLGGKGRRKQSLIERQLEFYSKGGSGHEAHRGKPQVNVRDSAVAVADKLVGNGGLETRISDRLTAAGISLTAAEWLLLHAGIVVAGALLGFLLSAGNPLVVALVLGASVVGPWALLRLKESRRLKAFNSQLADTLQLMAGGLSAGLSLPQAVDTVVREGAEPVAGELRRALIEQRLGVDIEDALDGVAERMQSKDFSWVVMAVRIQREIGGNLAELLDTVAATLREREYLRRQVRTLSAEGRLSAAILGGLPPLILLYLGITRGEYLSPLYSTGIGLVMCAAGVVLMSIGVFWLKMAVKVEV